MKVHVPELFEVPESLSSEYLQLFMHAKANEIKTLDGIFLAGPCIREKHYDLFEPWRNTAIDMFEKYGFKGDIFSPEPFCRSGYQDQILWEEMYLTHAKVIMFWIPRQLDILPAFTSNVEFGEWMKSGKVVLGYPPRACKMGYLQFKAERYNIPVANNLERTVKLAIEQFNHLSK